jgi:hypothetical protein
VFQVARRSGRKLLILTAVASMALSACGGTTATSSPTHPAATPTATPTATGQPTEQITAQPTDTSADAGLDGAAAALKALTSYKVKMVVVGGSDDLDNNLTALPNAPDSGVFNVSGTFVFKPTEAADVTIAGLLHDVAVANNDYQDVGVTGTFNEEDGAASSSLAFELSPASIYSAFDFTSGFDLVGSETKDKVAANHFHAGDAALAEFAAIAGVQNATWTADVWLATSGGYPVSITIVATATDKSIAYERSFDLTEVNGATNKVTVPTNVSGA